MTRDLILLWLAAFPLMGSPGPATLSLAGMGTAFGFRRARGYLLGIVLGTVGVLLLIASGVTALVLAEPALVKVLTFAAVGYILYLAWKIATAPVGAEALAAGAAPAFGSGLALALANPKAFAAIGAVYAGHRILPGDLMYDTAAKIAALSFVILVVNTAWLAFGTAFAGFLSDPGFGRVANIVFAILLVVSAGSALI